ncbi:MAG: o-succinylbenzoate synthase [Acidimicrobiales bacterium]
MGHPRGLAALGHPRGLAAVGRPGANQLVGLELVRVCLPLRTAWASEAGTFSHRDSLLVRAVLSCPGPGGRSELEGWGECGALPEPTYSPEYTQAAAEVAARYLVPALLRQGTAGAAAVAPALAPVKGHKMAKAAFEAALLDAELRAEGLSMGEFFASYSRTGQPVRTAVAAGVAVGRAGSTAELVGSVARYVEQGYRRVKLKVAPGRDLAVVSAVRERWPDLALFADANGAYGRVPMAQTVALVRRLEEFELACLEQPLGDEDLAGHAELARRTTVPICLDEALTSLPAVVAALDLGACSVVNVKAGRLGGYLEAVRVHDVCAGRGVPAWCGGMVETGVARAANVALAALSGFSLPGDLSATGRFFEADLTSAIPLGRDGTLAVPSGPGLGVSVDTEAVGRWSTWRQWWPAG